MTAKSEKAAEAQRGGVTSEDYYASSSSKGNSAGTEQLPPYNPAEYKPGEGYAKGAQSSSAGGQIVLVDEEDGSVIGELTDGYNIVEQSGLKPGSKGMSNNRNESLFTSSY
jgi:spartin